MKEFVQARGSAQCCAIVKAAAHVTEDLNAKVTVEGAKENINFNIVIMVEGIVM